MSLAIVIPRTRIPSFLGNKLGMPAGYAIAYSSDLTFACSAAPDDLHMPCQFSEGTRDDTNEQVPFRGDK